VLIFSDPEAGEQHGYVDGWQADGCFHYTGEGQRGDQQMKSGNRSILDHEREGRGLRLFQGARGRVRYIDEFVLAEPPFYHTDAPETGDGPIRSVIVFRLKPKTIDPLPPDTMFAEGIRRAFGSARAASAEPAAVQEVAVEELWTERMFINPRQEKTEAERREAALVTSFRDYLRLQGHQPTRLKILPEGETKPIFTDLYVRSQNLLVEAKGTVERGAIRMALGQLLDYRRFAQGARCAILIPTRPRDDLVALVQGEGVELFWREGENFKHLSLASAQH
jgi:hypothetical protein